MFLLQRVANIGCVLLRGLVLGETVQTMLSELLRGDTVHVQGDIATIIEQVCTNALLNPLGRAHSGGGKVNVRHDVRQCLSWTSL